MEGFGVDLEGRVLLGVPLDDFDDIFGDLLSLVPVVFEPLLQLGDFAGALDLDVELDVGCQSGCGEVTGADERLGADDGELAVGDVGLGVELGLGVDAALDLARAHAFEYLGHVIEEGVLVFGSLQAGIEHEAVLFEDLRLADGLISSDGHLVAHQDADLVQLLPLAV